jgi:hypothetical protein
MATYSWPDRPHQTPKIQVRARIADPRIGLAGSRNGVGPDLGIDDGDGPDLDRKIGSGEAVHADSQFDNAIDRACR